MRDETRWGPPDEIHRVGRRDRQTSAEEHQTRDRRRRKSDEEARRGPAQESQVRLEEFEFRGIGRQSVTVDRVSETLSPPPARKIVSASN